MSNIGNKIKEIRKSKKITQKELAEKINKSEITIRKYESGDINVGINTLREIAKALNIPIESLILSAATDSLCCESPELQTKTIQLFADGIIAIGMDMYKELTYEEMQNIAYSKELALFLEYMYMQQIQNRYKKQIEEITNKK